MTALGLIHKKRCVKWRQSHRPIRWGRLVSVSAVGGEGIPVPGVFISHSESCFSSLRLWSFYQKFLPTDDRLSQRTVYQGSPATSREHGDPLGEREGPETQRTAPGHPVQNAEGGRQQVLRRLRGERCRINTAETLAFAPETSAYRSLTGQHLCRLARLS